jgi:hypothetical protein
VNRAARPSLEEATGMPAAHHPKDHQGRQNDLGDSHRSPGVAMKQRRAGPEDVEIGQKIRALLFDK